MPPPPISASQSQPADQLSRAPSSPSLTHPSVTSPMLSSAASVSNQPDGSFYSGQESPAISEAVPSSVGAPAATSSPRRKESSQQALATAPLQVQQPPPQSGPSPLPQQIQQFTMAPPGSPLHSQTSQPQFPPGVKPPVGEQQASQQSVVGQRPPSASKQLPPSQRTSSTAFPGSLSDLVVSFENVKQKAAHRMTNLDQVHKMLEGGHSNVPQPQDTEKPKYYVPRNPFQTAPYYPQSLHPALSTPAIFSQLDVETLFYVFYFLPGTYQQFLAAKELKRQSWRFHVKYLTWFQRHSEPQAITEEYEQGVYVYFDWEGSWCQRKKSDFRFEYRYLSED
ncbi:hypothetical protein C0991_004168 [Blastosporella zonata]|nr:hypothetical protein C0991_004168 [Blastosporella zonata]